MTERRAEPRYLTKEDVFVWDMHQMKGSYHDAKIIDVSRNGMGLESDCGFAPGRHLAIDFRGMIVCGIVQYCRPIENRFAIGIRITDLLDSLGATPVDRSAKEEAGEAVAMA